MRGGSLGWPVERWLKISALTLMVTSVLSYALIFACDASRTHAIRGLPVLAEMSPLPISVDKLVSLIGLFMKALAFCGFGCIIGLVKQRRSEGSRTGFTDSIATMGLAAVVVAAMALGVGLYWAAASLVKPDTLPFDDGGLFVALQMANSLRDVALGASFGLTLVGVAQVAGRMQSRHRA